MSLKNEPCEMADLLISYLEQIGVEFVFGVPGGAISLYIMPSQEVSEGEGFDRLLQGMNRVRLSWLMAMLGKLERSECAARLPVRVQPI